MDLQYSWVCTAYISLNPQRIQFILLHMERTYIVVVQRGVDFDLSGKLKTFDMFHLDFHVFSFQICIIPVSRVFYNATMLNIYTMILWLLVGGGLSQFQWYTCSIKKKKRKMEFHQL